MPTRMTPNEIRSALIAQTVSSWTPGIKPTWTIEQVRCALSEHRVGSFYNSSLLVDSMGEDDQIPQLAEKRIDALLQRDFELQAVDTEAQRPLSERIADQLGPLWWDSFPESELFDLLRWYHFLGVGIGVLDWERSSSEWRARLRVLPPHFLRYDETAKIWYYNAQEGELIVTPGDGKWVLLTRGQRGWMYGLVRQMAICWLAKQLTARDWNRYNERHGLPMVKAMAPAVADEADKNQFWEDCANLASESVAQLPTHLDENGAAFDLELLEAKDDSWESFERHLDRCDRRFSVIWLGGNLSTEVASTGANRAAAQTHDDQLRDKAQADGMRVATDLRLQALWPIVALNFAGAMFEATPWPYWDTTPPEDVTARAQGQETFVRVVRSAEDAGYEVENLDELAEQHGLQLRKREGPSTQPGQGQPPSPGATVPEPQQRRGAAKARARLASGAARSQNEGFVDGQLYADDVVDDARDRAGELIAGTLLSDLLSAIDGADSYQEVRERVLAAYQGLAPPEELRELVAKAWTLADLAGAAAVRQDVGGDTEE